MKTAHGQTWNSRIVCLLLGVLAGCDGSPTVPPAQSKSSQATPAPAQSSPVDDMLQSAMYHLQPENIETDGQAVVSVLNDWIQQASTFDPAAYGLTPDGLKTLPDGWLTEQQQTQLLSPNFTVADAVYVRNSRLASSMVKYATAGPQAELDRVVALFEFTMRTVTLQDGSVPQLPFPLNEILLLGQGTPDDRAWVFAALLKQQRIDTVVLQSKDDPDARLVGVILDGQVYLFDVKLGLPIPRGDDPPASRITRPATLREMQDHPDWWQPLTLRADQPYPWSSDQLAAADVFVYTTSESWNGRMQQLEKVLPPESTCALYDPLVDAPSQPALAKRIQAGNPDWVPEQLKPWGHPLSVGERARQMGQQVQQLSMIFQRLRVPLEVIRPKKVREKLMNQEAVEEAMGTVNPFREEAVFDMNGPMKIAPSDVLWTARVEQLVGKFTDAIRNYHRIRLLALETPPQEMNNPQEFQTWNTLYQLAAADASYWSAAAKVELEDDPAAEVAFRDFLKRYFRSNWASAAKYQLALILARSQKLSEARAVIAGVGPEDPHRPGLEILQKQWTGLEDQSPPEKPAPETQEPSDDTPAEESGS